MRNLESIKSRGLKDSLHSCKQMPSPDFLTSFLSSTGLDRKRYSSHGFLLQEAPSSFFGHLFLSPPHSEKIKLLVQSSVLRSPRGPSPLCPGLATPLPSVSSRSLMQPNSASLLPSTIFQVLPPRTNIPSSHHACCCCWFECWLHEISSMNKKM